MFAVHAAELQYHHDVRTRDREHRILAAMRERSTAPHPATAASRHPAAVVPAVTAARPQRAAWPRPIGLSSPQECPAACAVA